MSENKKYSKARIPFDNTGKSKENYEALMSFYDKWPKEFFGIMLASILTTILSLWFLACVKVDGMSFRSCSNSEAINASWITVIQSLCAFCCVLFGKRSNIIMRAALLLQVWAINIWIGVFTGNFTVTVFLLIVSMILIDKYYDTTALKKAITAYSEIKKILSVGDYVKFPQLPRHDGEGFYDEAVKIKEINLGDLVFLDEKTGCIVMIPIIRVYNSGRIECKNVISEFDSLLKQAK